MDKKILWIVLFLLAACSSPPTPEVDLLPSGGQPVQALPPATTGPGLSTQLPPQPNSGLEGRLLLIQYDQNGNRLVELDLESGRQRTLFQAAQASWLSAAQLSPSGDQILLAYAPPPPQGQPNFGYTDLFLLAADGPDQPQPFLTRDDPEQSFFYPTWAADGQSVYYTHLEVINPQGAELDYQYNIQQTSLSGETKTILESAMWPVVSPDGSRLAYLTVDPVTLGNHLYIAGVDGSNPTPVLPPGEDAPVDDHFFTADGEHLVFSMVNPQPAPASSWWESLTGIRVASAHSVPSDWYTAPVQGGEPRRLTFLNDVGLAGDISPDGNHIAFISATGLYVMAADGSNLIQLSKEVWIGTVDWVQKGPD